jgi:hypothetical protein
MSGPSAFRFGSAKAIVERETTGGERASRQRSVQIPSRYRCAISRPRVRRDRSRSGSVYAASAVPVALVCERPAIPPASEGQVLTRRCLRQLRRTSQAPAKRRSTPAPMRKAPVVTLRSRSARCARRRSASPPATASYRVRAALRRVPEAGTRRPCALVNALESLRETSQPVAAAGACSQSKFLSRFLCEDAPGSPQRPVPSSARLRCSSPNGIFWVSVSCGQRSAGAIPSRQRSVGIRSGLRR